MASTLLLLLTAAGAAYAVNRLASGRRTASARLGNTFNTRRATTDEGDAEDAAHAMKQRLGGSYAGIGAALPDGGQKHRADAGADGRPAVSARAPNAKISRRHPGLTGMHRSA
jgi:hypothetical protein